MFANLNLPMIIAVVIAGIVGLIVFLAFGNEKARLDKNLDKLSDDYKERCLNDASGAGGDGSTM